MYSWAMCGLDTLETITMAKTMGGWPCPSNVAEDQRFGRPHSVEAGGKTLYLYPEHLKLLYERFKDANPKGVVLGPENSFDEYALPGLTEKELED